MERLNDAQQASSRRELSFGTPEPNLPTTSSNPDLSVPVTAFMSPKIRKISCCGIDATAFPRMS